MGAIAGSAARARAAGRTVVLCHGGFDLLHMGHVRHLEEARRGGDLLMVSVTEDRFVDKGPDRPAFGPASALLWLACAEASCSARPSCH